MSLVDYRGVRIEPPSIEDIRPVRCRGCGGEIAWTRLVNGARQCCRACTILVAKDSQRQRRAVRTRVDRCRSCRRELTERDHKVTECNACESAARRNGRCGSCGAALFVRQRHACGKPRARGVMGRPTLQEMAARRAAS